MALVYHRMIFDRNSQMCYDFRLILTTYDFVLPIQFFSQIFAVKPGWEVKKMTTLYEVLGLSEKATQEEIRRAYRRLAKRFHPDRNTNDPTAEEKYKAVCEAHAVLSDPKRRRKYDRGFDPVESVEDLFTRQSDGLRTVATMLPSAPLAPQPGINMMVVIEVTAVILKKDGMVDVKIKGKNLIRVRVPAGANRTPWCRIKGLGDSGRNGANPGDLIVYLRQPTASKGEKGKVR